MELLTLIASFLVAVSFSLAPCAASDEISVQKSIQHFDHAELTHLSLPRKLKFHEETAMKTCADEEDCMPHNKFQQPLSDTKQHEKEEKVINAAEKGSVFEEGPNKSEYFTMDYGWVRRRRPIHNKQVPFVP